ncbi:hypothetical protein AB0952_08730 [Streptomyces caniferus]|uniref:hypothetical protein n=1 Tax=Streptomyces caniferus TaxID=285557 RepID=UPI0034566237
MGAQIHYSGRIAFGEPVPTIAIKSAIAELCRMGPLFSLTFTADGQALTGLVADASHTWGHTGEWAREQHLLHEVARREQRTLTAEATWVSVPGPFTGVLLVDTSDRFHYVLDDEPAEKHRQNLCDCYLPTACERCGDTSFLARDEDAPGRPALCVECHEEAGTSQAAEGHCCLDSCALSTEHDGLCRTPTACRLVPATT